MFDAIHKDFKQACSRKKRAQDLTEFNKLSQLIRAKKAADESDMLTMLWTLSAENTMLIVYDESVTKQVPAVSNAVLET